MRQAAQKYAVRASLDPSLRLFLVITIRTDCHKIVAAGFIICMSRILSLKPYPSTSVPSTKRKVRVPFRCTNTESTTVSLCLGALIGISGATYNADDYAELKEEIEGGEAIAKGICNYLGVTYKAPVVEKPAATSSSGTIYRVQVGAYSSKANAEAMLKKLKAAGFDGVITTK